MPESRCSSLNYLNYINPLTCIFNTWLTYLLTKDGSNADISEDYQTLVTPPGWSFMIWLLIFISQTLFIIAQLIPRYATSPLVQTGVGNWYILICIVQVLWMLSFTNEIFIFDVFFMFLLFLFLLVVNLNQNDIPVMFHPMADFWLFRFPFQIHLGWVTVALVVNINVLLVFIGIEDKAQVWFAGISLGVFLFESIHQLFIKRVNFVIPSTLAWATLGIAIELSDPKDKINTDFTDTTITTFCILSYALFVVILVLMSIKFMHVRKNGYPLPGDSNSAEQNGIV